MISVGLKIWVIKALARTLESQENDSRFEVKDVVVTIIFHHSFSFITQPSQQEQRNIKRPPQPPIIGIRYKQDIVRFVRPLSNPAVTDRHRKRKRRRHPRTLLPIADDGPAASRPLELPTLYHKSMTSRSPRKTHRPLSTGYGRHWLVYAQEN